MAWEDEQHPYGEDPYEAFHSRLRRHCACGSFLPRAAAGRVTIRTDEDAAKSALPIGASLPYWVCGRCGTHDYLDG